MKCMGDWCCGGALLAHRSSLLFRNKRPRRDVTGRDIAVVERIEHRPQHVAFELERVHRRGLLVGRLGMVDVLRRKGCPVGYFLFSGEQHGFRKADTIKRCLDAELAFYAIEVFKIGLRF